MQSLVHMKRSRLPALRAHWRRWLTPSLLFLTALPVYAQSTGSDPWDNAVNVLKTSFTGSIAQGLSLVAIVVGGLMFAYGEGQSKKTLAGIVFGVGTEAAGKKRAPEVNINSAHGQPYVVFEGTSIDTVLVNRLDGEFAGPLKVMVTNPIYSQDRQHLLVPEGTFILGEVQKVSGLGQKRLAVTFHRLLMPDGYSVDLDQFHGLDQAGATGLKDQVNNHYLEIFGASIALGIISGAAEATNANQGYNESGSEAYKADIASSLSQSSANVLDRFINIPPTITIREGHRIKVYITQDMLLPAYENHTVPSAF